MAIGGHGLNTLASLEGNKSSVLLPLFWLMMSKFYDMIDNNQCGQFVS